MNKLRQKKESDATVKHENSGRPVFGLSQRRKIIKN